MNKYLLLTRFLSLCLIGCLLMLCIQHLPANGQDSDIVTNFKKLTKSTEWQLVGTIKMKFRTYHPQGMVIFDDYFYFSAVEIIEPSVKYESVTEGYDRSPGKGIGHLFKADMNGNLVDSISLGKGSMYHPGGIDYDGKYIWVPVAEYRPNSESIIYRIEPCTMEANEVFRFKDHIGGIVHNTTDSTLHGVSWGSRLFYTWKLNDVLKPNATTINPKKFSKPNGNHYIDYQDCHYVKDNCMLCGGLNGYQLPILGNFALGGLDLIDLGSQIAIHQIVVPQWIKPTLVMTRNPFFFELKENHLRFYFMPEDDESTIYIFDVDK